MLLRHNVFYGCEFKSYNVFECVSTTPGSLNSYTERKWSIADLRQISVCGMSINYFLRLSSLCFLFVIIIIEHRWLKICRITRYAGAEVKENLNTQIAACSHVSTNSRETTRTCGDNSYHVGFLPLDCFLPRLRHRRKSDVCTRSVMYYVRVTSVL